MNSYSPSQIALALSIVISIAPAAFAQSAVTYQARRPSIEGPSATIDRVGGYNTNSRPTDIGRPKDIYSFDYNYSSVPQFGASASNYSRQIQAGRSQNIFNPSGSVFGLPNSAGVPSDYGAGQAGRFISPRLRGRSSVVQNAADSNILRAISGFDDALSDYTPLLGWSNPRVEPAPAPYFAPNIGDSSVARFFELRPAEEAVPPPTGKKIENVATLLQEENSNRLKQLESQAIQFFQQGTTPTTENREERLAQALDMLTTVAKLKQDSSIAPLLAAHAALARQQVNLAARSLFLAIERNPTILTEEKDMGKYYGDPKMLLQMMEGYLRIGDQSGSGDGFALQAYAAWIMGDHGRTEQALNRLVVVTTTEFNDPQRSLFAYMLAQANKQ